VSAKQTPHGTAIDTLRQSGSLRLLFPRTSGTGLQAALINTSGGVTGGDTFSTKIHAKAGSHLTVTTQAAERAYAAQHSEIGRIDTHVKVDDDARLSWLPQETILFNNCAVRRKLSIDMAETAQLLAVETLVFGRTAMGEVLTNAQFHDTVTLTRNGHPAYRDAMRFSGDVDAMMRRPGAANGAGALATILYAAPDVAAQLKGVRALLGPTAGATLLADGLLLVRSLATDSYTLRQTVMPVLTLLAKTALPRTWMT